LSKLIAQELSPGLFIADGLGMQKNHYEVLGVMPSATAQEIKTAYRAKMRQYHPDFFAGQKRMAEALGDQQKKFELDIVLKQAEEMAKQLNAAYLVLSDPVKRRQYDMRLSRREMEPAHYTQNAAAPYEPPIYTPPAEEAQFWGRVFAYYLSPWIILLLIMVLLCGELARAFGS
jgi:curved DNA-binding protein CbpA